MQRVTATLNGHRIEKWLPGPEVDVLPGVPWGRCQELFTPAFWATCAWQERIHATGTPNYRTGANLQEEVAFCLLSGHGITAEMAWAAFDHLRSHGVFHRGSKEGEIASLLAQPHRCGSRTIRYRFPNRRGHFVAEAIRAIRESDSLPENGKQLRDWLLALPGIGPKTASFIVRNWCECDEVAVIDIHVQRAGLAAGFFREEMRPEKHYFAMERRFIAFAEALGEKASFLDLLMWSSMRRMGPMAMV